MRFELFFGADASYRVVSAFHKLRFDTPLDWSPSDRLADRMITWNTASYEEFPLTRWVDKEVDQCYEDTACTAVYIYSSEPSWDEMPQVGFETRRWYSLFFNGSAPTERDFIRRPIDVRYVIKDAAVYIKHGRH
ncbi:hypothetical protein GQ602_004094 [Ophiocordyceps camponoti-floridani]|uniref:Uncharacterized protein n=1 Tax=Ophiocordyceps camponoti-floridani TaxID=2030778 RepID=A0A8H4Q6M4_9HYPO|nr:hypothetical protein GQ602_004094 [Ophiocordyceps camponoti-floridani]